MVYFLLIPILVLLLVYILYINGFGFLSCTSALMFIQYYNRRKQQIISRFKSCNGYTKKIIKFKESKYYTFDLNSNIELGHISILLMNKDENVVSLDKYNLSKDIFIDKNIKYTMCFKFKSATGKFNLTWK